MGRRGVVRGDEDDFRRCGIGAAIVATGLTEREAEASPEDIGGSAAGDVDLDAARRGADLDATAEVAVEAGLPDDASEAGPNGRLGVGGCGLGRGPLGGSLGLTAGRGGPIGRFGA
jgi:hypothetical protein